MITYLPGQIQDDYKGDMAVAVTRQRVGGVGGDLAETYDGIDCPMSPTKELAHITGVDAVRNPITRLYLGISSEAAELLLRRAHGQHVDELDLGRLDMMVVMHRFVRRDTPERITLERTTDGQYVIVEPEG